MLLVFFLRPIIFFLIIFINHLLYSLTRLVFLPSRNAIFHHHLSLICYFKGTITHTPIDSLTISIYVHKVSNNKIQRTWNLQVMMWILFHFEMLCSGVQVYNWYVNFKIIVFANEYMNIFICYGLGTHKHPFCCIYMDKPIWARNWYSSCATDLGNHFEVLRKSNGFLSGTFLFFDSLNRTCFLAIGSYRTCVTRGAPFFTDINLE